MKGASDRGRQAGQQQMVASERANSRGWQEGVGSLGTGRQKMMAQDDHRRQLSRRAKGSVQGGQHGQPRWQEGCGVN